MELTRGALRRRCMKSRPNASLLSGDAERPACSQVEAAYQRLKQDIMEGIYTPRQRRIRRSPNIVRF